MLGVLNQRGAVVPVFDLRVRFALSSAQFTPATVIIVLSLRAGQDGRECGVVVDDVRDVVDISLGSIRPAPSMLAHSASEFIEGITNFEEQILILLNPDVLVGREISPATFSDRAA
jgi:purine-binding chemotaxis protein CheW